MRIEYSLNDNWRFRRKDAAATASVEDMFHMFKDDTKTGAAAGPAGDGCYDGDWETVNLPDDWCTRAEFVPKGGGQGCKPRSAAWYRRSFYADPAWDGQRVFLRFDGIAIHSKIWLNGILIAESTSGYTPISEEITALLRYGDANVLSVCASNEVQEGWWYEGGGIYRDVWLTVTGETRLAEDGVFCRAEKTADGWMLKVRAEVDGPFEGCSVEVNCLESALQAPAQGAAELTLPLKNPPLWSPDAPNLVPVEVTLLKGEEALDHITVPFGFRTVRFDAETGFFLNDVPMKLQGVCMHHDHAGVGVALTEPIQRYRIQKLREMGCNAIRTSHNPQSPSFYRACDELGMLVMNETRHFSATREVLRQLRTFVRRDRNHPCVIFWSLFNEEPLQCSPVGEKIALAMKKVVAAEDGTRPVSGGMNGALEPQGAVHAVDMMGFNYLQYGYDDFHALHPQMPVYGSENDSWCTSRGERENRQEQGYRSAFLRCYPENLFPWSAVPGTTWKNIAERPFVFGGFSWTGMDYRGEARWPAVVSPFGAMDLCGFAKDEYWWYRSLWRKEPLVRLSTHWSGMPGEEIPLAVYSNCEEIRLLRNGEVIDSWKNDVYDPKLVRIAYEPGEVTAIGYLGGAEATRHTLRTAGKAASLILTPSAKTLCGLSDLLVVDAALVDAEGTVLHESRDQVTFSVTGGRCIGVGNGDPASLEPDRTNTRRLYHGLAQGIVQPDGAGMLTVKAVCGEITEEISVPVLEANELACVPATSPRLVVAPWRMSDVKPVYPAPADIMSQMVNWIPTTVGCGKNHMLSGKTGFASITGIVTIPLVGAENLTVVLERIMGIFDLYLDGKLMYSAPERVDRDFRIPCPGMAPGSSVTLALVFRLDGGDCGIPGGAYLEC